MLSVAINILAQIILDHISEHFKSLIGRGETSLRSGSSCTNHINILRNSVRSLGCMRKFF